MFRHPQLTALERRKWDLVAKSAALRDDLEVEAIYWKKASKWADIGISVAKLIGGHRHWAVGILGALTAWMFKKRSIKAAKDEIVSAAEEGKSVISRFLKISRNILIGWKLFRHAKETFQGYCATKRHEP